MTDQAKFGMAGWEILPITLLTGFLGSGKTSLLRRALASPALSDTAVIVNELGEIAIDHHLLELVEGNILELPGGCLCCEMREDLAKTLRDLLKRRDSGAVRPFSRIVVETTGLADPGPILYTLGADAILDDRLRLARVVTVIDAESGAATLERFDEARRQAAVADLLVITKTDLVPLDPGLTERLAAINPAADRVISREVEIGTALLGPAERTLPAIPVSAAPAAHSHGIDAFCVVLDGPITRMEFARTLGGLAQARGNDLLRVKGIVAFADRPDRPALVQAAQHTMYAPEWLDDWPVDRSGRDRRSRLVFIVQRIPRAEILAHFASAGARLAENGAPAIPAHGAGSLSPAGASAAH